MLLYVLYVTLLYDVHCQDLLAKMGFNHKKTPIID